MKKSIMKLTGIILTVSLLSGCGATATDINAGNITENQAVTTDTQATTQESDDVTSTTDAENSSENNTDTAQASDSDTLVVYFTRAENIGGTPTVDATSSASINLNGDTATGNLKIMADYISDYTGADEFSIITVNPYPEGYRDTTDQAKEEQNNDARPELATHIENFENVQTIYLGFPVWWSEMPMALYTFLGEYDFSGKTIIPFSSNEGSGFGSSLSTIEELCPDATILDGLAVKGSDVTNSQSEIEKWIDGLGL